MKQKLLCSLAVLMFFLTILGGGIPLQAAQGKSLEEAIKIAKSSFAVPLEYKEFTSYYNEAGGNASWQLNWSSKEGEMNIEVDARTGEILRMHQFIPGAGGGVKLPKLTYQKAKEMADVLVQKLQPQRSKNLALQEDSERPSLDINPWGSPRYNFRFQRVVEGIPVTNNGINISVNGDTGAVLSYSFDWYGEKLVVPPKLLTAQEAQQVFSKEFPLELLYFRTTPKEKSDKPLMKLVYQLRHPNRVLVDPVSGKLLEPEEEFEIYNDMGLANAQESKTAMDSSLLTPEEAKEVSKIASLISKEKAILSALKVLQLSEDYKLDSSGLQRIWEEPDRVVWQLSWRVEKEQSYRSYAHATVDGETGELLSFNHYRYDEDQGHKEPVYNLEQSKELAWQLISELQPEKAKKVKYYPAEAYKGDKPLRSYRFIYERLVNGIPFPQNGFEVRVNGVTGQVESYNLRWSQAEFPEPNTVVDQKTATAWYGEDVPLTLEFVTSYSPETRELRVKLLYHLAKVPYTMLDGVSGMPLNRQGEPWETSRPAIFSDIKDHPAKADIELLANAGIIEGTKDGKFHPDAAITQGELAKLLAKLDKNQEPIIPLPRLLLDPNAWYTSWINEAVKRGVIKAEEVDPEETVTREFMAATLVRYLKLERAAALPDLYRIEFEDGRDISPKYIGHVVLAAGLKIMDAKEKFLPMQQVTRGEAATALVRTLLL